MFQRMLGVFKLSVQNFEEIEADQSATGQAALVVLLVGIVSGLGSLIFASTQGTSGLMSFLQSLLSALLGWLVLSAVTWFVGTNFFGGKADLGEMLRVLGFAATPLLLGIIPCVGWIVGLVWYWVAGFIAIRQGLDLDNTKTLLTIIIGAVAYIIVFMILGVIFGVSGALLGNLTS
jgi:hypothetical protein